MKSGYIVLLLSVILFGCVVGFERSDTAVFLQNVDINDKLQMLPQAGGDCNADDLGTFRVGLNGEPLYCDSHLYRKVGIADERAGSPVAEGPKKGCCPTRGTQFEFVQGGAWMRENICSNIGPEEFPGNYPTSVTFSIAGSTCQDWSTFWDWGNAGRVASVRDIPIDGSTVDPEHTFPVLSETELVNLYVFGSLNVPRNTQVFTLANGMPFIMQNLVPGDKLMQGVGSGSSEKQAARDHEPIPTEEQLSLGYWLGMRCTAVDCSTADAWPRDSFVSTTWDEEYPSEFQIDYFKDELGTRTAAIPWLNGQFHIDGTHLQTSAGGEQALHLLGITAPQEGPCSELQLVQVGNDGHGFSVTIDPDSCPYPNANRNYDVVAELIREGGIEDLFDLINVSIEQRKFKGSSQKQHARAENDNFISGLPTPFNKNLAPKIVKDANGLALIAYLEENPCLFGSQGEGVAESGCYLEDGWEIHLISCKDITCDNRLETTIPIRSFLNANDEEEALGDYVLMTSFDLVELDHPVVVESTDPVDTAAQRVTAYLVVNLGNPLLDLTVGPFKSLQLDFADYHETRVYPINGLSENGPAVSAKIADGVPIPDRQSAWGWRSTVPNIDLLSFDEITEADIKEICATSPTLCPLNQIIGDHASGVYAFQGPDGLLTMIGLAHTTPSIQPSDGFFGIIFSEGLKKQQKNAARDNYQSGLLNNGAPFGNDLELLSVKCLDALCLQFETHVLLTSRDFAATSGAPTGAQAYGNADAPPQENFAETWAELNSAQAVGTHRLSISSLKLKVSPQTKNGIISLRTSTDYNHSPEQRFHCVDDACSVLSWTPSRNYNYAADYSPLADDFVALPASTGASLFSISPVSSPLLNVPTIVVEDHPYGSPHPDGLPCSPANAGSFLNTQGAIRVCTWVPTSHNYNTFSHPDPAVSAGRIYAWQPAFQSFKEAAGWKAQYSLSPVGAVATAQFLQRFQGTTSDP